MKKPTALPSYALTAASILSAFAAQGQVLFSDNFDATTGATWLVNGSNPGATGDRAVFLFDYSTMGIPSAPRSTGGTTIGVQLIANYSAGVLSGISISPSGLSLSGDYTLTGDVWMNFNGPANVGGTGSTQVTGMAIGTAGTSAQWVSARDSIQFVGTGDGQSATDYRVYPNAASAAVTGTPVTFAAGTAADARNNTNPYYAGFGGDTVPAGQTAINAAQAGTTSVGALGFDWHNFTITKAGNTVTWDIDGTLIATVDTTSITTAGSNIALIQSDTVASSAPVGAQDFVFSVFDNVTVTQVPEPSTYALLGLGALGLFARARRTVKR